jgi:hypothetical protein
MTTPAAIKRGRKLGSELFAYVNMKQLKSVIDEEKMIPVQKKWIREILGIDKDDTITGTTVLTREDKIEKGREDYAKSKPVKKEKLIHKKVDANTIALLLPNINIVNGLTDDIYSTCRGDLLCIRERVNQIKEYCNNNSINKFGYRDWAVLSRSMGINPFGLTANEITELRVLRNNNRTTLKVIAATLGMNRLDVRDEVEPYLVKNRLITIDGLRDITSEGLEVLDLLESSNK